MAGVPPGASAGPAATTQLLHMRMANLSMQQNGVSANGYMNMNPASRPVPGLRPQPPTSAAPQVQPYNQQAMQQPPSMQPLRPPTASTVPAVGVRPHIPQSQPQLLAQQGAAPPPMSNQPPPPQQPQHNSQFQQQRPLRPVNMRPAPGTIPTRPVPGPYPNPGAPQPQLQPQGQVSQPQLQAPPTQQQRQAPQISPLIVPRPSHKVLGKRRTHYFRGMATLPDERGMSIPHSNDEFISVDDGSARLRFARLTTNAVASDPSMMTKSCVPFAIMLTPFANQAPGEAPVPVVDYSGKQIGGPLRCERCKAYANPGFKFLNGGREFRCNLCSHVSKTPPEHFSAISHTGQRMDIDARPELRYGSVEYLVGSPDYWVRPPKPARYLFAFDVSSGAIASGLSAAAMLSVKSAISAGLVPGTGSDGARIAIMTFDRGLHFFDARGAEDGSSVRMQYVPDVMDPFVPIGGDALFLTSGEAVAAIESAMEMHGLVQGNGQVANGNGNMNGDMTAERQPPPAECALGSALYAIKEAFTDCGGKAFVVAGSIPTTGVNKLERRGGGAIGGGEEREMALLREANPSYDILGCELAEVEASVDLFLAPASVYVDVSTLSRVPRASGGRMFLYTGFDTVRDGASLHRAICTAAREPRAFEALMRIRMSPGIEPRGEYIGHFGRPQRGDDVSGPVFDASSTIGLEMAVVSKLSDGNGGSDGRNRDSDGYYGNSGNVNNLADDACVQCAILFTDSAGRRRIRVHTVFARKSTVMADLFSCADVDATAAFLAKRVASAVLVGGTGFSKAWDGVMEKMAQMFYMYRKHCTSSSVSGQLILPESYKVLPLMMLGLIKSAALRKNGPGGESVTIDERASALSFLLAGTISEVASFCYPRIWELQDLPKEAGIPLPPPQEPGVVSEVNGVNDSPKAAAESNEPISLPNTVAATAATLADDKVLLMENGMQLVLWIGAQLSDAGAKDAAEIFTAGPGGRMLICGETANSLYYLKETGDVGKRVAAIIQRICGQRKFLTRPAVVERAKPGAGGEGKWVLPMLVEDRGAGGMYSYMEYLRVVHKEVMDRMANDSAQSDLATWEMLNHGY